MCTPHLGLEGGEAGEDVGLALAGELAPRLVLRLALLPRRQQLRVLKQHLQKNGLKFLLVKSYVSCAAATMSAARALQQHLGRLQSISLHS